MAEKILNTRIQLKYDTLANWQSSTFNLKKGELAIVSVGEMKDGSTHANAQYPVLFKVGTGEHTFAQLPFASALAADVYGWAKASDVKLVGKTIQFVNGDNVVKSIELNYITESEAQTLINNALTNYSTTEQMNTAIKVETDRATGVESGLDTRLKVVESAVGENGSVNNQIKAAIEELDSTASQTAGDDGLALSITLADGKVTTISGSIAAGTYDKSGAANEALATAKTYAESQASAAQAAAEATAATDATSKANAAQAAAIEAAAADATSKANEALATAKTYAEGQASAAQSAAEGKVTELANGAVKANTEAIAAINNADTGILASAKAYTDEVKADILGEGIKDTFDTLVEIQTWIEGDGVDATELTAAIAAETKNREDAVKGVQDQIDALGIKDGKVENAATADVANSLSDSAKAEVKAVKVDNATNADVAAKASGLDAAGEAAVKAVKVDNAGHADSADDAAKLGGVVAANYALKTDAQGYANTAESNANTYTDGEIDKVEASITNIVNGTTPVAKAADADKLGGVAAADYATKSYADQAEADALAAAKEYANGLADNYATAAQGEKADSALQSIEAGTGLKVTAKADNKQTVEIDESVVFVFDCGNATDKIYE